MAISDLEAFHLLDSISRNGCQMETLKYWWYNYKNIVLKKILLEITDLRWPLIRVKLNYYGEPNKIPMLITIHARISLKHD